MGDMALLMEEDNDAQNNAILGTGALFRVYDAGAILGGLLLNA
jgi:hypothetical protein